MLKRRVLIDRIVDKYVPADGYSLTTQFGVSGGKLVTVIGRDSAETRATVTTTQPLSIRQWRRNLTQRRFDLGGR